VGNAVGVGVAAPSMTSTVSSPVTQATSANIGVGIAAFLVSSNDFLPRRLPRQNGDTQQSTKTIRMSKTTSGTECHHGEYLCNGGRECSR
jgi:hypothetical protein